MTDYSGLVKRLREGSLKFYEPHNLRHTVHDPIRDEAAAAIEALVEEVDRLHSVAQAETDMRVGTFDTITQLQNQLDAETKLHLENESRHMALAMGWKNRIERLEGALRVLLDHGFWPDDDSPEVAAARAALEAKS